MKKKIIVVFDERLVAAGGDIKNPLNTPEKRIRRRRAMLTKMARFMDADKIEYQDLGKSENYIITRGRKKLNLLIRYNKYQGAFLNII